MCDALPSTRGNQCSLRAAIQEANATAGADTIEFDIADNPNVPGLEVKTITPNSSLPTISDKVSIDGHTQPGASENSATTNANSAVLKIQLRGANAPSNAFGLAVSGTGAAGSTIKGLVINRFGDDGLFVNADNTVIEGNFIGTNAAGDADLGNGADGVHLLSSGNLVGGPANAAQNIISGNAGNGVSVQHAGATANDARDPDKGPNNLQNRPVIEAATTSGGSTTIEVRLNSIPNRNFTIEFFSNPAGNEGETFLRERSVTTDANGLTGTVTVEDPVTVGETITASATGPGGNTSEFSNARVVE